MKNNDEIYNELKGKFEECPELPESLKKENVVAKLQGTEQEKVRRINFKEIGSVAAVVVLAIITALMANNVFFGSQNDIEIGEEILFDNAISQQNALAGTAQNEVQKEYASELKAEGNLRKAQSREEIEKIIAKNYTNYEKYYLFDATADGVDMTVAVTAAPGSSAGSASDTNTNFNSSASREELKQYGETNTQTKGVDEADIIKNDGRYLYVVGYDLSNNRKLRIIDTETMTAVYNGYIYNDSGDILDISEIYVSGNTLVAVGTYGNNFYDYGCFVDGYGGIGGKTVSVVMDITDRASPKTLRKTEQDGSYRSSRMMGSVIYTLTEYTVSGKDEEEAKQNSVPEVAGAEIKCDCIYIIDEDANRYICLTAYDTAVSDGEVSSLAVLGSGGEVYCSENNFYVIGNSYVGTEEARKEGVDRYSVISAFSLNGTSITFKSQGEVPGYINNQYSLDEYQGNLRIATTAYNRNKNADVSSLYVLGSDMKIIGKVEDIANNEQIKSVRYMGNKAYVVTFRNTDPLFVIDLKDPTKPTLKGELKLPGYSAYMHPLSEDIILGIGYNGDSQNADFTSLKVSLFDVSDMANPKEISNLTYDNSYSYVVDNPKAFVYNSEESYMVLPVEVYGKYELSGYACYVISTKNNKLTLKHEFKHEVQDVYSGITFLRGTYIGDELYTVSDNLTVKHSLKNGEKLGECKIYEEGKKLEVTTVTAAENTDTANGEVTSVTLTTPPYNPNN